MVALGMAVRWAARSELSDDGRELDQTDDAAEFHRDHPETVQQLVTIEGRETDMAETRIVDQWFE
jgi:hypothetical protein